MKCSAFLATSLDGYIADAQGSIAWLEELHQGLPAGEDCGYGAFAAQVDAIVMGRHSFEQVLCFPEWPYPGKPVFVLSTTLHAIPAVAAAHAQLLNAPPAQVLALLGRRGYQHLYIDGGATIRGFLAAGLLDEITITLVPRALGQGRALFGPESRHTGFELLRSHHYPCGFVQNTYRVLAPAKAPP